MVKIDGDKFVWILIAVFVGGMLFGEFVIPYDMSDAKCEVTLAKAEDLLRSCSERFFNTADLLDKCLDENDGLRLLIAQNCNATLVNESWLVELR